MVNKHIYISVSLVILLIAAVNTASYALDDSVQLQKHTSTEHITIKQINRFLSSQLKGLVLSKPEEFINYDYMSIRETIDRLLEKTNKILQTSYRQSSKDYRSKCNFLMIQVSLKSLLKNINRLDECKEGCGEVQLITIKQHIEYEYDYLTLKSRSCSQYLGSSAAFDTDFRTLNFSDSCEYVVDLEAALGSQRLSLPVNFMIKFTGIHIGRMGEISYSCDDDGLFNQGSILYNAETLEQAKTLYDDLRQVLISKYGTPSLDGSSEEYSNFMMSIGAKITEREKTQLAWYFENYSIVFYMVFPEKKLNESAVIMIYSKRKKR